MRHLGKIGDDGFTADGLAERHGELRLAVFEIAAADQFAQEHGFARLVRQFYADGVATGNDGDTGGNRAHGAGDVISKTDDARGFDAGRRFQFVKRDDRAGADMDDFALDPEILENAFQKAGVLFQHFLAQHIVANDILRFCQKMDGWQLETVCGDEGGLRLPCHALAGLRSCGRCCYSGLSASRHLSGGEFLVGLVVGENAVRQPAFVRVEGRFVIHVLVMTERDGWR
ncbi:hypothetical protein D3C86_1298410 [compost metagenome]